MYKCLTNKTTAQIGTTVRAHVFKCRTAGYKSVRIRKVLRPANSIKVFRGFRRSLEQMLSWYPNSTLHCMPLMQTSQY
jgi:hypothetical protein